MIEQFSRPGPSIAVAYLARGADSNWPILLERFIDSYKRNNAGIKFSFYVIFKGFLSPSDLESAKTFFRGINHEAHYLDDNNFDIGAYAEWATQVKEDLICVFNTGSEILAADWLNKLFVNLMRPNVGLVGATGSYESLENINSNFPAFPNAHIRSSGFLINRKLFCSITQGIRILDKWDAYRFESGQHSLTNHVLSLGKDVLLVGRNGRGYSKKFWASSDTFRQGSQNNLLISDNQTRNFLNLPWDEKRKFVVKTWGRYIDIRKIDLA
jgi:hypothetical protein